jgi:hypothetical protein
MLALAGDKRTTGRGTKWVENISSGSFGLLSSFHGCWSE